MIGWPVADILSRYERSALMAKVKSKNTKPEIYVRSLLHRMGYRFRLHHKELPGTPDIVLPRLRLAVFVNGCFWHQHTGCSRAKRPTSNIDFWNEKLDQNFARDRKVRAQLAEANWIVLDIWECEVNKADFPERLKKSVELTDGYR